MKKLAIAASSVALAAMPVVGVFAVPDFSDTIQIEVEASCTFTQGGAGDTYSYADGTNTSGAVSPKNASDSSDHVFKVFCNNNSGYKVNAATDALKASGISDVFSYVTTNPAGGTTDGTWHAQVAASAGTPLSITQLPAPAQGETTTSADIVSLSAASGASGEQFTVTYSAYIGTETPAGTYSGTIGYTLTPNA